MKRALLTISFCCLSMAAVAQTLNRQMVVDSLWESTRINTVANKAYLLVHSQVANLRFESNRAIDRVNPISTGDWEVWLPAGTHILKVDAEGFQRLELPARNYTGKRSYELIIRAVGFAPTERADNILFDVVFNCNETGVYSSYGDYPPTLSKQKSIPYELPKGTYTFRFQKQGFVDEVRTISLSGPQEVAITMKAGTPSGSKRISLPGIIRLTSDPTGAEVLINGQKVGNTPYDNELSAGEHQLELRKPMYYTDVSRFTLVEGKTVQIPRTLKPRFGFLTVTSTPSNASIYVDGKLVGSTPLERKELESTRHTLRLEAQLYHQHDTDFEIKDGLETRINQALSPAFGALEINSTPESGADVFLDGQLVGKTPFQNPKLASGRYVLKVAKQLFSEVEERITVSDGEPLRKTVVLSKNFGEIQVTAPQSTIYLDGKRVGVGSYSAKLSLGRHALRAERGVLYIPAEQELYVSIDDKKDVTLEPQPRLASLSVFVEPREASDAEILIGDETKGNAPKVLPLLIGDYTITVKKSNYLDASQSVSLAEGDKKRLDFTMFTYEGSIQAKRNQWGQAKWITAVATVLAGGAAAYFNSTANNNYNSYQNATTSADAVKYRDLTKKNHLYFKVSVGVAGVGLVSSLFSWIMQTSQ